MVSGSEVGSRLPPRNCFTPFWVVGIGTAAGRWRFLAIRLRPTPVRRIASHLGPCHERTGIPMKCIVLVETERDATLLVHGSYHASYRFHDKLIVTDRDTYFFDLLVGTRRTASGRIAIEPEQENAARVIFDFLDAVRAGRPSRASGPSVLPAIRVLQAVQDKWDGRYGARAIPGRPL
jgi:2-hydroxy-4-carboxymuconate semialdehyde hemiacetal dehydrogenase